MPFPAIFQKQHTSTFHRTLHTKGMSEATIYMLVPLNAVAAGVLQLKRPGLLVVQCEHKSHINSAASPEYSKHQKCTLQTAHNHKLNSTCSEFPCKCPSNYKFSFSREKKNVFGIGVFYPNKMERKKTLNKIELWVKIKQ